MPDVVPRDPVSEVPAPVFLEGVAETEGPARRRVGIVLEHPRGAVEVEPGRQRPVEEPGIGEADDALLGEGTGPDADRRLVALAQEVALGEVDGAHEAVGRGVAAADREDAGRLLGDLDVDDDLGLVGSGAGGDVDHVEVAEVDESLPGPRQLLQREQVTLDHGDLAPQDLVLGAHVAADVDALHVHDRPLDDLEHDVDLRLRRHLIGARGDVGRGPADRAVEVGDAVDALAERRAGEDVPLLELELPAHLALGQQGHPGDADQVDVVLGTLHHPDHDRHPRPLPVHGDVVRFDPGLDEAVVVVEGQDAIDVLFELLALHGAPQDEVLALLDHHGLLDVAGRQSRVALDDDPIDGHAAALVDDEGDPHVAVRELLDLGGDLRLEVALFLVVLAELLASPLDVDGVIDAAELEVDLLQQGVGADLLVAGEVDVADERALGDHEHDPHPALEVLDPHAHVVEESEPEDPAKILAEEGGVEGAAELRLHPTQDHRLLDATVTLDREFFDEDGRGLLRARLQGQGEQDEGAENGEGCSPPGRHRALGIP